MVSQHHDGAFDPRQRQEQQTTCPTTEHGSGDDQSLHVWFVTGPPPGHHYRHYHGGCACHGAEGDGEKQSKNDQRIHHPHEHPRRRHPHHQRMTQKQQKQQMQPQALEHVQKRERKHSPMSLVSLLDRHMLRLSLHAVRQCQLQQHQQHHHRL
jgi:hypothetical protein